MLQASLNLGFFFLDTQFIQGIVNSVFKLIETIGFLENIISTKANGFGDFVDLGFTTQHYHGCLYLLVSDER